MNLFELFIKISVDDEASDKISNLSAKMSNGLQTAAKVGVAAAGAAMTAVSALAKQSIESYAEYEQLVGGVETLFKESSDKVIEYANNAYKTAGLSANKYMSTVTSFSASLLQSLGGDTEAVANFADMAISDMSDNANKMGTSMEMIQNAYQGFAKQNYTMLDNLKLGYGGTKTEMERLLRDAEKMGGFVEGAFDIDSFADVVEAINIVQTEMGITGTTAKEAAETISGSIDSMKAAWENLLTGISDGNADLDVLLDNFMDSVETVVNNIAPVIGKALPRILEAGKGIIKSLLDGIASGEIDIADVTEWIITFIIDTIVELFPLLIEAGISIIAQLLVGILQAIPRLLRIGPDILNAIVESLFSVGEKIAKQGEKVVQWIKDGIASALQGLVDWFNNLWDSLFNRREVNVKVNTYENNRGYRRYKNGLDYVPYDGYVAELDRGERVLTAEESKQYNIGQKSYGDIYINVDGAKYTDPRELAEVIAEELQFLTDRKVAAYA